MNKLRTNKYVLISLALMFIVGLIIISGINLVNATETETYPVNTPIDLQFMCTLNNAIPESGTTFNLTITYQNGSYLVNNQPATAKGNGAFNYTLTFQKIGLYKAQMFCTDGTYSYSNSGYYEVNGNGKKVPDGFVIVLFSLAFIIIMGFLVYELILSIGHFASLDLDVVDLAKSIGIYFALFALYELSLFYLGNPDLEGWLLMFIKIGGFTHIIIPITGFLISITVGSLKKKQVDFGTRRILRRQLNGKI